MKHCGILIIVLLLFVAQGCIPSLHGIAGKEHRTINDQIIGTWHTTESVAWEGLDINISIQGETDPKDMAEAMDELESITTPTSEMIWKFERAAQITFKHTERESTIRLSLGAPSLAPAGFEPEDQELLDYYLLTHHEIEDGDTLPSYMLVELTQINEQTFMDFKPFPLKNKLLEGRFASNYIAAHTFARVEIEGNGLLILPFDAEYIEELLMQKRARLKHELLGEDETSIILTASTEELRAFIGKYGTDQSFYEEAEILTSL